MFVMPNAFMTCRARVGGAHAGSCLAVDVETHVPHRLHCLHGLLSRQSDLGFLQALLQQRCNKSPSVATKTWARTRGSTR